MPSFTQTAKAIATVFQEIRTNSLQSNEIKDWRGFYGFLRRRFAD